MNSITWANFEKVHICVGTIIAVNEFPEAKKPAYQLSIDFGETIGIKQSSAQITALYTKDSLVGKQVVCVLNFAPKKIGPFISEVLVTGFANQDGNIVLCVPEHGVPNGARLI